MERQKTEKIRFFFSLVAALVIIGGILLGFSLVARADEPQSVQTQLCEEVNPEEWCQKNVLKPTGVFSSSTYTACTQDVLKRNTECRAKREACRAAVWQMTQRCMVVGMGAKESVMVDLCRFAREKAEMICRPTSVIISPTPPATPPLAPAPKKEEPLSPPQDVKPNEPPKVPEPQKVRLPGKARG